jgi:hypothetical protein
MWVLMIAFPVNVARKNFQNGIPNCPHKIPARSKRGFGTCSIPFYQEIANSTTVVRAKPSDC